MTERKRLTTNEKYPHGAEGVSKDKLTGKYCRGVFEATACVEKLAEYETAEEEGRLVVLPCMVGDTVYSVTLYNGICKHEIRKFITDGSNTYACSNCKFPITDFGIRVFLTREEAEKALEKMKKNERILH